MVLRLKTRESRSLPGLLKARNTKSSARSRNASDKRQQKLSSLQSPAQPNNRAALKRPFCFGKIKPDKTNGIWFGQMHGRDKSFGLARIRHSAKAECRDNAGWSSPVARQAHNLKAAGSNPAPATTETCKSAQASRFTESSSTQPSRSFSCFNTLADHAKQSSPSDHSAPL
jgi:hypothetical protein